MSDGSFCLIVSDNFDVQDLYVLTLRTQRIRALSVGGRDDAMRVIRCLPVAAVLYDVERLPDWESLAAFRREIESSIPIVVASGGLTAGRSSRLLARQMGCAAFIVRPCSPSIVVRAMQHVANGGEWIEYEELAVSPRGGDV